MQSVCMALHKPPGKQVAPSERAKRAQSYRHRRFVDEACMNGKLPIEVMIETMRELYDRAQSIPIKDDNGLYLPPSEATAARDQLLLEAVEVAKIAAPYVHPRLSAVEVKADVATHNIVERDNLDLEAIAGPIIQGELVRTVLESQNEIDPPLEDE